MWRALSRQAHHGWASQWRQAFLTPVSLILQAVPPRYFRLHSARHPNLAAPSSLQFEFPLGLCREETSEDELYSPDSIAHRDNSAPSIQPCLSLRQPLIDDLCRMRLPRLPWVLCFAM